MRPGAGDGDRTRASSLGSWRTAIVLHRQIFGDFAWAMRWPRPGPVCRGRCGAAPSSAPGEAGIEPTFCGGPPALLPGDKERKDRHQDPNGMQLIPPTAQRGSRGGAMAQNPAALARGNQEGKKARRGVCAPGGQGRAGLEPTISGCATRRVSWRTLPAHVPRLRMGRGYAVVGLLLRLKTALIGCRV